MKPTAELLYALIDGSDSSAFLRLLKNYGIWSRYFGAVGYLAPHCSESYVIKDETALFIDRAMQKVKSGAPGLFKILTWYYVNGLDEDDIKSIFKPRPEKRQKIKHAKFFAATPEDTRAARYLNLSDIRKLLIQGEAMVYNVLIEMVKEPQ